MAARRETCDAVTWSNGGRRFVCTMPKGHTSRGHWWQAVDEVDDGQLSLLDELRCRDCGEPGEQLGHMGCQYPGASGAGQ